MIHCWKDYKEWLEENGHAGTDEWLDSFADNKTCMAISQHDGPHVWVSDSDIIVEVF